MSELPSDLLHYVFDWLEPAEIATVLLVSKTLTSSMKRDMDISAQKKFLRLGAGRVPDWGTLTQSATKQFMEILSEGPKLIHLTMKQQVKFSKAGSTPSEVKAIVLEIIEANKSEELIVESGNKYGVDSQFHEMNSALQLMALKDSDMYHALSPANQERVEKIYEIVFNDRDMRNRNCLHPGKIDCYVISNLLNFPKHIFGFPFACHGTDGNEALSLCLFSYRTIRKASSNSPAVVYVRSKSDKEVLIEDIKLTAARINLEFVVTESLNFHEIDKQRVAVVMTDFYNPAMDEVSEWARSNGLGVHIHLRDRQWRDIFAHNNDPVHFELPIGVRTVTIEEGLLNCGYTLYRDLHLRDNHVDVPYAWQTAYFSPNEGGSGASAPLFADFCTVLMGWSALGEIGRNGHVVDRECYRLSSTAVQAGREGINNGSDFNTLFEWAKKSIAPSSRIPLAVIEAELICFQRNFMGGKNRDLEAITTAGGTRSINLAFETVLKRARSVDPQAYVKVLTGNPHLAVERAERRFEFDLIRIDFDGTLMVDKLREEVKDPAVAAVYTQTLSYTDGITDPLEDILMVLEDENIKRAPKDRIVLINDSCLAFSVLVHNTGVNGTRNLRILDLSANHVTPVILTLDAHKHLGSDKGVSTVVGTKGTLSLLNGHIKVGAQPTQQDLVRALANMQLVGVAGYTEKYRNLGEAMVKTVNSYEAEGLSILHNDHRAVGSTVVSVADPFGLMIKKIRKKGHYVATLFGLHPKQPKRTQSGFQLSLTPYALRPLSGGSALDVFLRDIAICNKDIQKQSFLVKCLPIFFSESSFFACLLTGNLDPWILTKLLTPGSGRELSQNIIRRYLSSQLDCGTACSARRPNPLGVLVRRVVVLFYCLLAVLVFVKRQALLRLYQRLSAVLGFRQIQS